MSFRINIDLVLFRYQIIDYVFPTKNKDDDVRGTFKWNLLEYTDEWGISDGILSASSNILSRWRNFPTPIFRSMRSGWSSDCLSRYGRWNRYEDYVR